MPEPGFHTPRRGPDHNGKQEPEHDERLQRFDAAGNCHQRNGRQPSSNQMTLHAKRAEPIGGFDPLECLGRFASGMHRFSSRQAMRLQRLV